MPDRGLHDQNRLSWNAATEAHNSHKGDQASFFRDGGNQLHPEERELLGDIADLTVLHLQCNSGQDTLSLAQLGATVTGVDISDTAIEFARALSADSGVPATFHRADVYDWLEDAACGTERYDVVFSSYGATIWLSDLDEWGRGIAAVLGSGGRFVYIDFHPVWTMIDDDWRTIKYPYSTFGERGHLTWDEGVGDYVAMTHATERPGEPIEGVQDFKNPHWAHEFAWGLADVVMPLLNAGLRLTTLKEYPYSNSAHFPSMRYTGGSHFLPPEGVPPIPLMYGIVANKE